MIYNNHLLNGNCAPVPPSVSSYLLRSSVSRLFVGHQPHGDCPSVILTPDSRLAVFLCDTSYSDPAAADNRGGAHANVTVGRTWTRVDGVGRDGRRNVYLKHVDPASNTEEARQIGRQRKDQSWVKGRVSNGTVMVAKGEGFRLDTKIIKLEEI